MIRYLCDVKDCGKEAHPPSPEKKWVEQEMFNLTLEGASYFWARVGIANITLCDKHRGTVMRQLAERIQWKYPEAKKVGQNEYDIGKDGKGWRVGIYHNHCWNEDGTCYGAYGDGPGGTCTCIHPGIQELGREKYYKTELS